jgi:hypothetical protein
VFEKRKQASDSEGARRRDTWAKINLELACLCLHGVATLYLFRVCLDARFQYTLHLMSVCISAIIFCGK